MVAPVVADSQATYTPGISERRGTESRFYHGDIKNFVEQTDSSGQIVSSQQYDAFGNPVSSTGTWQGPFAYGGRFGYQSDSDTSLSLLGHRYYDPTTGRFLSRDPIGDGRNWYAYVANNPVRFADPTGLSMRPLSPKERQEVAGAIDIVDRNGYHDAATELRNLLNLGLIYVDPDLDADAQYDHNVYKHNDIRLNPSVIPDAGAREYRIRYGSERLFRNRIWLASVLYHEYIHGEQLYLYKLFERTAVGVFGGPNRAERGAWGEQRDFLKAYLDKNVDRLSTTRRGMLEELVERASNEYRNEGG